MNLCLSKRNVKHIFKIISTFFLNLYCENKSNVCQSYINKIIKLLYIFNINFFIQIILAII